jgi:acyl carrier protein
VSDRGDFQRQKAEMLCKYLNHEVIEMNDMETIRKILSDNLDCKAEDIKPESLIMKDLGADSLDMVELAMAFEEAYGLKIETDDIAGIKTVQDLADFITAHKS